MDTGRLVLLQHQFARRPGNAECTHRCQPLDVSSDAGRPRLKLRSLSGGFRFGGDQNTHETMRPEGCTQQQQQRRHYQPQRQQPSSQTPHASAHLPAIHLLALGVITGHEEAVHLRASPTNSTPLAARSMTAACKAARRAYQQPHGQAWQLHSVYAALETLPPTACLTWETYWKNSASVRDRSSCTSCSGGGARVREGAVHLASATWHAGGGACERRHLLGSEALQAPPAADMKPGAHCMPAAGDRSAPAAPAPRAPRNSAAPPATSAPPAAAMQAR